MLLVICREFAVSGLRMVAGAKGVVIAAGQSGKVKTAATMICLCVLFLPVNGTVVTLCNLVILLTTLWSGIEYFVRNRALLANA